MKKSLIASIVLLVLFIILAFVQQNYEFLFYSVTLIIALALLVGTDKKFNLSQTGLWGFFIWLLMHLLGGMAYISGTRLYDYILFPLVGEPYSIFKYDQLVHITCYFVIGLLVYDVLRQLIPQKHTTTMVVFVVLAASGIGAMNEIIEFLAVVFVGSTGVGGYHNTALDIVANFIGASLAVVYRTRDRFY